MSTYATIADLEAYAPVPLMTSGDSALQKLLDIAEKDVDRLMPRSGLTDSLQGIAVNNASGGDFTLALDWQGSVFTTDEISWNATEVELLDKLNSAVDIQGLTVPGVTWQLPRDRVWGSMWARGPLSTAPIVVEATGRLAAQQLPALTAAQSLTGVGAAVAVQMFRGGGTRIDIWTLQASDADQLKAATCAQAVYRDQMGPDHFVRAQYKSVSGPEFNTTGALPIIGPQVKRELAGSELLQTTARAVVSRPSDRAFAWGQSGTLSIPDDWRAI